MAKEEFEMDASSMGLTSSGSPEMTVQANVPAEDPQSPTLNKLAIDAIIECDNDIPSAAQVFLKLLRKQDADLYREKQREAMAYWAESKVGHARRQLRDRIAEEPAGAEPQRNSDPGLTSLRAFAFSWFNWPLLPGVMLRTAKLADLESASAAYMRDADSLAKRGRFIAAIAKAMPNAEMQVSQALNEAAIAKLAVKFGVSKE